MLIKVCSASNLGLKTIGVDVEVNVADKGLPVFEIVGLPSKAVGESRQRVKTAIINSNIDFPAKRIIVNLAPADVPKEGSFYDLPVAAGIISSVTDCRLPHESLFFGELSLDGTLRHTRGALLFALFAKEKGIKNIFVPKASANEAAVVKGINVYPIENLSQLLNFLIGQVDCRPLVYREEASHKTALPAEFDMSDIVGQEQAKRALEICAAGGHNLLMVGSPGSGKTMLARALPGILPLLNEDESLEVTKIYSASGRIPPDGSLIRSRPFRAPHHNISQAGLIGGGSRPRAGEISLAHRGVLFLDEFNEFSRSAIEALRQPMEDGRLTISRSRERADYPSRFMLVASANPCPCGFLLHPGKPCICTQREIERYRKKISGPILDRIGLHVEVPLVDLKDLANEPVLQKSIESSFKIRKRVVAARKVQAGRFCGEHIHTNAEMKNQHIKAYCVLSDAAGKFILKAGTRFQLSARSYFKIIKLSRTIADLDRSLSIEVAHAAEALQYRPRAEAQKHDSR